MAKIFNVKSILKIIIPALKLIRKNLLQSLRHVEHSEICILKLILKIKNSYLGN